MGEQGRGFYVEDSEILFGELGVELSGFANLLMRSLRFGKGYLEYNLGFVHDADPIARSRISLGDCATSQVRCSLTIRGLRTATYLSMKKAFLNATEYQEIQEYYDRVIRMAAS